ncbi:hypothetical protein [Asanoa iriomotensis]|uniref:Uncharacterized protein n=1 Tax=Asanoa iriomotensis TaxID=234613 RepID=A0ABQ4BZG5_9ACTN|nr:hypothetical protein [Asanoa iriomotensis]GIF55905.1 hypothetical protein Air01nite_20000 [Asanoa iriomotensis]
MELLRKWAGRVGAVVTAATLAVFVPAVAWASTSGTSEIVYEAARRRRGGLGFLGVGSLLCCLVVIALIVLAVVLVTKRSRKRG